MTNEHIDPIYKHVDDYIDDKLKRIKRELQQLKQAHDAIAAEQKAAILRTQLFLADFMVRSEAQSYRNLIGESHHMGISVDTSKVVNQLVADTTRATTEIRTSKAPLSIAVEFTTKWQNNLKELGFPTTQI